MTIQVNPIVSPRIITVPEADGESITIQSLVNQIRAWEDDQVNLCYPRLLSATGKESLGGDVYVGITAVFENAKLKFAERSSPTDCDVLGGNLVAVDANENPMNPIAYSTNVTVALSKSSSATIVNVAEWTQSEKDKVFSDAAETQFQVADVQYQVGEVQYQLDDTNEDLSRIKQKSSSSFDRDTDSLEAIRDRGDEAWGAGAPTPPAKGFDI